MMKTLCVYNVDGVSTESCDDIEHDTFRKVLKMEDNSHTTELLIAKKLMTQPQSNVVKIYDVVQDDDVCYIDMELLDDKYVPFTEYRTDIRNAISQLHSIGVIYIDIKEDNLGYSTIDQKYKLFDFNCSGIIDIKEPKKWQRKPFEAYQYKKLKVHEPNVSALCDLDYMSWELTYKDKW